MLKFQDIDGIGPYLLKRIREEYPDGLKDEALRANPYLLTKIHGIGFKLADRVALALDVKKDAPMRVNAAALHVLGEAEQIGHTCLPGGEFAEKLSGALGTSLRTVELDEEFVTEADGFISRRATEFAEQSIASKLGEMMKRDCEVWSEPEVDGLFDDQIAALAVIQRANIFALMGGPGVGKTYLVRRIIEGTDLKVALAAPTGKAAKRIEELAGERAQTIHRLLGVVPRQAPEYSKTPRGHSTFRFRHSRENPLPWGVVIVDEASMIDVKLMADLCDALAYDARLILVGDPFQLPAVGPGAVLRDLTSAGGIPYVELTELKRQDPKLLIARNCKAIRFEKKVIVDNGRAADFFFMECADAKAAQSLIVEMATVRLPEKYGLDSRKEIVVLSALREKGAVSVKALNIALRARLNPDAVNHVKPTVGDRVIQLSNNYALEIMNGDIGTVLEDTGDELTVRFDTPEREITEDRDEFHLDLAYALTTHKFQGSEAPAVVIAVHEEQGQMVTSASWLYTSVSRAKEVCVVVGSRRALDAMAARHRDSGRYTRLGALIKA